MVYRSAAGICALAVFAACGGSTVHAGAEYGDCQGRHWLCACKKRCVAAESGVTITLIFQDYYKKVVESGIFGYSYRYTHEPNDLQAGFCYFVQNIKSADK